MTGATIFGCAGPELGAAERDFFRAADPWGFILFARNLENPEQIRRLCNDLRESVGREAVILIDQEGGRVARLRPPQWLEWLPPLEQMQRVGAKDGPRSMWIRSRLIAAELRDLGIDGNCAPMADVPVPGVHEIIRNRCYGFDAAAVAAAARQVADGLLAGGVLPVLKHIPGHGRPIADSHLELPQTDAPLSALEAQDFAPFKALNDLPMAMTAHVVYRALDPERCATLSPVVVDRIRRDIGFDGLLMTDDLSMHALSGTFTERSQSALQAGCDLVLHCHGVLPEMEEIAAAAGALSARAERRAEQALAQRQTPQAMDRKQLLAALARMLMLPADD